MWRGVLCAFCASLIDAATMILAIAPDLANGGGQKVGGSRLGLAASPMQDRTHGSI